MYYLKYKYLIFKHKILFSLFGGIKAKKQGKIKVIDRMNFPNYALIFQTKYFIWWIPIRSFENWRLDNFTFNNKI
jgi:hypothetical protein